MGHRIQKASTRLRESFSDVNRTDVWFLAGSMVLTAVIVIAYVAATRPNGLEGDQREYQETAAFFAQGKLFWSNLPFGIPHPSLGKAPAYTAWSGLFYTVAGDSPTKLGIAQGLIFAPLGVLGSWLLARSLFGNRTARWAALVVAVFPLVWEYYGLLYPEVLAVPLTAFVMWAFLGRQPTRGIVVAAGVGIGLSLLVRPTALYLFAGILVSWIVLAGFRSGLARTAIAVGIAALVVAPWTIRNMLVEGGGFVPISYQDAAAFGTFNPESANDPIYPYAWRPVLKDTPDVLEGPPVSDVEFRRELQSDAFDYIKEHPFSVVEAFYWNGLTRMWDVRRPARAMDEVGFEGRASAVSAVGLGMYYVILPLALVALWRLRGRRELVLPVLAMALAASILVTSAAATRYRATFEPLLVALAVGLLCGATRRQGESAGAQQGSAPGETSPV